MEFFLLVAKTEKYVLLLLFAVADKSSGGCKKEIHSLSDTKFVLIHAALTYK
jgi:hypothetical protein